MAILWGTLLAASLVAAYALAQEIHHLVYVGSSGEKDTVEHLVLYPLGILVAGGVLAALGVLVAFLADSALGSRRARGE
jgi:hypothetical protein